MLGGAGFLPSTGSNSSSIITNSQKVLKPREFQLQPFGMMSPDGTIIHQELMCHVRVCIYIYIDA